MLSILIQFRIFGTLGMGIDRGDTQECIPIHVSLVESGIGGEQIDFKAVRNLEGLPLLSAEGILA